MEPPGIGTSVPARILQPCGSCARILDVSGIALGERARCVCGALSSVARATPFTARALVCSRCGGAFQAGATACPYCEAGIALEDRHLCGICGRCSARLSSNAQFCPGCGLEVRDQSVKALPETSACPRCRAALRGRTVADRDLVECSSCGGLWLTPSVMEDLCAHAEDVGAVRRAIAATPPPTRPVDEEKVVYRPCVTCHQLMIRRNFGGTSGIIVDSCRDHGIWFDHTELVRVLEFTQKGGLDRAREREARRQKAEREQRQENAAETLPREGGRDPWEHEVGLDDVASTLITLVRRLFKA